MALVIPDLTQDITFRGVSLNDVAVSNQSGQTTLIGNRVDSMQVAPPELVQFTEKLALTDGLDYGPVYRGSRLIVIKGMSFDKTRGEAWDRVSAIEAVSLPQSGTFGLYTLAFFALTGAGNTPSGKSVSCRPNGLQVTISRDRVGNIGAAAIGIEWAITFTAMDPAIS